jgi:hypothetical protein
MRRIRIALVAALVAATAVPAVADTTSSTTRSPAPRAGEKPPASPLNPSADMTFSRFLALVQSVMNAAAAAPPGQEERAADRAIREVLDGKNPEANAFARDLFMSLPPEDQVRLLSIGRSASQLAERGSANAERDAALARAAAAEREAIDARKDLGALGFTYYDRGQFMDAIRRGDAITVQLFVRGRGVDLRAKDAAGETALDVARRSGNAEVVATLARAMQ